MFDLYSLCRKSKSKNKKLLSIYLTVGFPYPDWTLALGEAIFEAGADMMELGIPFSDPLADGPTIQKASMKALESGTTLTHVFESCNDLSEFGTCLLMGYTNSMVGYGREKFLATAKVSNASALIIPDLSSDEEQELWKKAKVNSTPIIPFIAPTTAEHRMKLIDRLDAPFIYAVSLTGVTGVRDKIVTEVISYLDTVRQNIQTPVLAGFGISNAEMAKQMSRHCDGVIIGSTIIQRIEQATTLKNAVDEIYNFVKKLRIALDKQ